jgi:hypothetical protein
LESNGLRKVVKILREIWVKVVKSGQEAGWTGFWAGPSGLALGLAPVRLPPGCRPVRADFSRFGSGLDPVWIWLEARQERERVGASWLGRKEEQRGPVARASGAGGAQAVRGRRARATGEVELGVAARHGRTEAGAASRWCAGARCAWEPAACGAWAWSSEGVNVGAGQASFAGGRACLLGRGEAGRAETRPGAAAIEVGVGLRRCAWGWWKATGSILERRAAQGRRRPGRWWYGEVELGGSGAR